MSLPENPPSAGTKAEQSPVVVKKYANRRLYNTESSSYITLDNLAGMIRARRDFVVYDARSGEDITRGVLTQIIVEEESKGRAMLPTAFLRQIIGFYGDSLQQFVPSYLEQAMTSFALQQEQMRSVMQQTVGNLFPGMQDIGRQNMAMMERAMSLFAPFYRNGVGEAQGPGQGLGQDQGQPSAATPASGDMAAMQHEIDSLRHQLAAAQSHASEPNASGPAPGTQPPASPEPQMPETLDHVSAGSDPG